MLLVTFEEHTLDKVEEMDISRQDRKVDEKHRVDAEITTNYLLQVQLLELL